MQFLAILDNFWQFWIILGNFWTIFWIFDNFCTIFRHFINITSTTIFSTLCSFRIMHVSSLHHHYVTVWWSGSGLRLIRDEIRDPEWNPGIRRKHMQRHPRFRIKKNRSRLVEQPRKENTMGGFLIFNHLKVIRNRPLDLVWPCLYRLFRRLRFRWLNWNSLKGDQGKAAANPIVYFLSP